MVTLRTTKQELLELDRDTDGLMARLAHDAAVAHVLARKLAECTGDDQTGEDNGQLSTHAET